MSTTTHTVTNHHVQENFVPHSSATTTTGITTRRAALAVTCLLAGLVPAAVSHADDDKTPGKQHHSTETCRGVRATHVNEPGTKGDDVIVITDAGIAEMYAGAGDDLICMKMMRSDDIQGVHGGTGNDTIITYSGQIYAFGGVGNDNPVQQRGSDPLRRLGQRHHLHGPSP